MIPRDSENNPLLQSIAANLRLHRARLGLNQTEFGKLIKMSQTGVSKMEKASYAPTLYQIYRICRGLNISVAALLGVRSSAPAPKSYKDFRVKFSRRLRDARESRELTQLELSEKVGMKQPTYNKIEKCAKSRFNPDRILAPDLETITHIARAMKMEPVALLID